MKKSLLLIFVLCYVTSCGDSNEDEYLEDYYIFQNVEYYVGDGDGIQIREIDDETLDSYNNPSDEIIEIYLNPYKGLENTSLFEVRNKANYSYQKDNLPKIRVPFIIRNNTEVITGERVWNYVEEKISTLPCDNKSENRYEINPHNKLTFKRKIVIEEITVSYTATYVGQKSGYSAKVTGKWKGQLINEVTLTAIQEPIQ